MAIDTRGADLKRYFQEDAGGPVVMLNPLRFTEGGRESYDQYTKALSETFLPRYGGEVVYAGDGGTPLVAEQGRRPARPLSLPLLVQPHGRRPGLPAGHAPSHSGAHRGRAPAHHPLVAVTGSDEGTPARGCLARTARLAALPAAYAGRTARSRQAPRWPPRRARRRTGPATHRRAAVRHAWPSQGRRHEDGAGALRHGGRTPGAAGRPLPRDARPVAGGGAAHAGRPRPRATHSVIQSALARTIPRLRRPARRGRQHRAGPPRHLFGRHAGGRQGPAPGRRRGAGRRSRHAAEALPDRESGGPAPRAAGWPARRKGHQPDRLA